MSFTRLFLRLFQGFERPSHSRRAARPGTFVPRLTVLEDRSLPSASHVLVAPVPPPSAQAAAQQQVPFKETLTFVSVSNTGVATYEGNATHFGHVTAILNPDDTFVKTAANGDVAVGYVTHATATTGTVTFTGGTGRFENITGSASYVISADPTTGAPVVEFIGSVSYGKQDGSASGPAAQKSDTQVLPFKVTGGGTVPLGLPVFPGGTAPHNATGIASHLGKYTGEEGSFELLSIDPATGTGTFRGSFVFVAANGDRLTFNYGADPDNPGTFTLTPTGDGKVIAVFVAEFTPVPSLSTGRFANVTGGSFIMVATSEPFSPVPNITALGFHEPRFKT